jgi:hypothetical protein
MNMKPQKQDLETSIIALCDECEKFALDYAELKAKGTGVPTKVILGTITGGRDPFNSALHIMAIQKRDGELEKKQRESERSQPAA